MIPKCGPIVIHHWAHYSGKVDPLCQSYEETEWHKSWKQLFSPDWVEKIIVNQKGEKRIADVVIPGEPDTVIEFQHSSISVEEIQNRILFHKYQRNILWVFNSIEPYAEKRLKTTIMGNGCSFIWYNPRLTQLLGLSYESHTSEDKRGYTIWNYKTKSPALFDLGTELLHVKSWKKRQSWKADTMFTSWVSGWGYLWNHQEFLEETQNLAKLHLLVNSNVYE